MTKPGASALPTDREHSGSATGTLRVITGCMFSGKTTALLKALGDCPPGGYAVFKHEIDFRYCREAVVTHNGVAVPARCVRSAADILSLAGSAGLIAIDEGHFFDASLVEICDRLVAEGREVMVTALNVDSWGRPFPVIDALVARAGHHSALVTECGRCGRRADRTQRLTPIVNGELIGGPESYQARCAACWRPPPEEPPIMP